MSCHGDMDSEEKQPDEEIDFITNSEQENIQDYVSSVANHYVHFPAIYISESEPYNGPDHEPDEVHGALEVDPEGRGAHLSEVTDEVMLASGPVNRVGLSHRASTGLLPITIAR